MASWQLVEQRRSTRDTVNSDYRVHHHVLEVALDKGNLLV
jgi:hypothetical protein